MKDYDLCVQDIRNNGKRRAEIKTVLKPITAAGKMEFDLEDCDRVLRVISSMEIAGLLIEHPAGNGFDCEELEYRIIND